ncbi:MAG: O-antigen ligase family protein [Dermatophilaceae bacterium]
MRIAFLIYLALMGAQVTLVSTLLPTSVDPRLIAVIPVLLVGIVAGRAHHRRQPMTPIFHSAWLLVALLVLSLAWTTESGRTMVAILTWAALILAGAWIVPEVTTAQLVRYIRGLLVLAIAASLALHTLGWPSAVEGGRLRGIMENANGLGLVCALALPLLLTLRFRYLVLLIPPWTYTLYLTGSRASALASAIAAGVFVLQNTPKRYRFLSWAAAVLVGPFVAVPLIQDIVRESTSTILRTNDSRSEIWARALAIFADSPIYGAGLNPLGNTVIGSSFVRILAELGVLGAATYLLMIRDHYRGAKGVPWAEALLAACLVNGIFESWLFLAGSFFYVLTYLLLLGPRRDRMVKGKADLSTHTAPQRSMPMRHTSVLAAGSPRNQPLRLPTGRR